MSQLQEREYRPGGDVRLLNKAMLSCFERDMTGLPPEKPPRNLTKPDDCLAAVRENGMLLEFVPDHLMTPELCLEAVKSDGAALEHVPEHLVTPIICLAAVFENGYALRFVPEELKTPELCLTAVRQGGYALEYAPKDLKTTELCRIAVENHAPALKHVPVALRTPELCRSAVERCPRALEYVPAAVRTTDFLLLVAGLFLQEKRKFSAGLMMQRIRFDLAANDGEKMDALAAMARILRENRYDDFPELKEVFAKWFTVTLQGSGVPAENWRSLLKDAGFAPKRARGVKTPLAEAD